MRQEAGKTINLQWARLSAFPIQTGSRVRFGSFGMIKTEISIDTAIWQIRIIILKITIKPKKSILAIFLSPLWLLSLLPLLAVLLQKKNGMLLSKNMI